MMPDEPTSNESDEHIAQKETQVAELVARCGNIYTRFNLSPPMALRSAAQHWVGLSLGEIARVVEDHLREHRRLYVCGSAERFFYMVEAAIRKALEAKHPSRDRADGELERLLRKRRGKLRPIPHADGVDVFDDRDDGGTGQEDDAP
jgi:hypothetical protein